ncbi:hypothetical protein PVAND_013774 [Polypedilum vanderplanki]|uniref:Uncharacterized protein n=1 Tax=Polypedilum vanderplanki TaxID=319348 RepID=A0A9J6CRN1_POLVA|nr:hypothetical protein PVAND_013774 [Polypedilum vanderplanki]
MSNLNSSSRRNAQEIFEACIKNVEECKKLLESQTNDEVQKNPVIRNFMEKTDESKKEIKSFSEKLRLLKKTENCAALETELGDIIHKLDAISFGTIKTLKEAVAASKVSKLKKEFVKNEEILNKLGSDAKYHDLVMKLIERNNKIVKCLEFARSVLPDYFGTQGDSQHQGKKKLFIIGDDLKMNLNVDINLEKLGEVTIHCESDASKISTTGQIPEYPSTLNGFLQHENGEKTEVVLKLKEKHQFNLMEFSGEESKMSATISIPGEAEEKIEVVEINLTHHEGPELLALVQNEEGVVDEVRVQLVPITPERSVHGKILELQNISNEENLDDIEMDLVDDSSNLHRSGQNRGLIDTINESIRMEESIRQIQENLAPKIKQIAESVANKVVDQIMQENEMNLNDVSEIEYADMSERSYRTPSRPNRSMRNPQQNLADVSEIQYADISENSYRTPARQNRSMKSPVGNLADVSEIQYADLLEESMKSPRRNLNNISGNQLMQSSPATKQQFLYQTPKKNINDISEIEYANISNVSNQSAAQRSMQNSFKSRPQLTRQHGVSSQGSPSGNLDDVSEIQYADISERSLKSPLIQQRSMRSPQQILADVSEIHYADISENSYRTPARQNRSMKNPVGNLADVSEIQYADISERSLKTPIRQQNSIRSPRQNLANISGTQKTQMRPNLQILKTPPPPPHASPKVREGILIDLSEDLPESTQRVQRDNFGGDLIQFSHDENFMNQSLGQNMLSFSPEIVQRKRQVPNALNATMPLRRKPAVQKTLNRSLQVNQNAQVQRPFAPVDVIPSRIPEDASLNYSIGTPEEMMRVKAMKPNNKSFNLSEIEAPFSDSFNELEEQLSEATQINRKVNELRLMASMRAQPDEEFAARFHTNQEMLDDFTLDDLSDVSVSEPLPPLPVQTAAEFAAKFNTSSKFLDDMTLGSDNDSFTPHSFRSTAQGGQPRRPNKSLPFRNQSVTEPKLLSFDD